VDFCRTIVEPGAGCVLTASAVESFHGIPVELLVCSFAGLVSGQAWFEQCASLTEDDRVWQVEVHVGSVTLFGLRPKRADTSITP
jgi:hypothetical protein